MFTILSFVQMYALMSEYETTGYLSQSLKVSIAFKGSHTCLQQLKAECTAPETGRDRKQYHNDKISLHHKNN